MTTLGLEYLKHTETARSNVAKENQAKQELSETVRSNKERESIQRRTLDETMRHNVATEIEQKRSNVARETETHRANTAQESLKAFKDAQEVAHWSAQDVHNREVRKETKRDNLIMEALRTAEVNIKQIDTTSKVAERASNNIFKLTDLIKGLAIPTK